MRKVKLQIQITVDGFVAGANGEMDWMSFGTDEKISNLVNELIDTSDTILMGRKMTDDFVIYWTGAANDPESPEYSFAQKMVNTPKVVFSRTIEESRWANTVMANGDLTEEIRKLKNQDGKDIIVYGGADFVSSLIKHNLIDEYHLIVNPVAIGKGKSIFGDSEQRTNLRLVKSDVFSTGEVELHYVPRES